MARGQLRIDKFHQGIEAITGYKAFDVDIGKDEVDSNPSFFMYYDKGSITKGENGTLLREFILMFITKENAEIDEYRIIEESPTWGLRFQSTDYDYGKIGETQDMYRVTTFYFNQVVRVNC